MWKSLEHFLCAKHQQTSSFNIIKIEMWRQERKYHNSYRDEKLYFYEINSGSESNVIFHFHREASWSSTCSTLIRCGMMFHGKLLWKKILRRSLRFFFSLLDVVNNKKYYNVHQASSCFTSLDGVRFYGRFQ